MVNVNEYLKIANNMCCHRDTDRKDLLNYDLENNLCTCKKCGATFFAYGPDQLKEIKDAVNVVTDVAQMLKLLNPSYAENCAVLIEMLRTLPNDLVMEVATQQTLNHLHHPNSPLGTLETFNDLLNSMHCEKDVLLKSFINNDKEV